MDIVETLKRTSSLSWRCCKAIGWGLLDDREKVDRSLALVLLPQFIPPNDINIPTVDIQTRYRLEELQKYGMSSIHVGISRSAVDMVTKALRSLVVTKEYTAKFELSKLHGFKSSKATSYNKPERVSQLSMSAMGREVNDLEELSGLDGQEAINVCIAHNKNCLAEEISLITDNWHKRYYWNNSGGSHHMARMCHELQRLNRRMNQPVKITEYYLDTSRLADLMGHVSIFIISRKDKSLAKIFTSMPGFTNGNWMDEKLGVHVECRHFSLDNPFFKHYQMVFVDHSKEYSDISYKCLMEMVYRGEGMLFIDFLTAFLSLQHQIVEPEIEKYLQK